jgi:hypothetical protein
MFIRHIQCQKITKPNNLKTPPQEVNIIYNPDYNTLIIRVLWYVKCFLIMSINVVCKQGEEGMLFLPVYCRRRLTLI